MILEPSEFKVAVPSPSRCSASDQQFSHKIKFSSRDEFLINKKLRVFIILPLLEVLIYHGCTAIVAMSRYNVQCRQLGTTRMIRHRQTRV